MDLSREVLRCLRRIIRAIDMHSKKMVVEYGLTGSQAIILRELLEASKPLPVSVLSQRVSLSHGTVTDILNRLHSKGYVARERDDVDKRRILVRLSDEGKALIESIPSLLQEMFLNRFSDLKPWERTAILATLQRLASLMDAEDLDAAPMLASGAIDNGD